MERSQIRMIVLTLAIGMVCLLLLSACGSKEETPVAPAEVNFLADFNEAMEVAKAEGKPSLIKFYTDWCKWCKVLDTTTFVDSAVVEYLNANFAVARANGDVDTLVRDEAKIAGYPTMVVYDKDGKEIDRLYGFYEPEPFLETLKNYMNGIGTLDYYLAWADTAASAEVYFALAEKYEGRSDRENALKYYEMIMKEYPDDEEYGEQSYLASGNILLRSKDYDSALKRFGEVMKKFKGKEIAADAEIYTAITYRQMGDTAKAIKWFEGFVKNFPESPDTSYALSQIELLKNPPPPEPKEE